MRSGYVIAGTAVGLCVVLALAGAAGYGYGSAEAGQACAEQRAAASEETSRALNTLATRFGERDSLLEIERQKSERTLEVIENELRKIPARGCTVRPDTHRVLLDAVCAAFGETDPACVRAAQPAIGEPVSGR